MSQSHDEDFIPLQEVKIPALSLQKTERQGQGQGNRNR